MQPKKTLEVNARHPVIKKIVAQLESEEKTAKDMLNMLWETANLASGFTLTNPATFTSRINRMVAVALEVADQLEELPPIIEPVAAEGEKGESADSADLTQFEGVD